MRLHFGAALALALTLCASSALATDISSWSPTDANNNAAPPNGWPSGTMLPSQVEPTGRAIMGAIARWYAALGGYNSAAAANTAALQALATTNYANGITRLTDGVAGAPPLRYVPDTGATCSADDGGSCIAAAAGGAAYWKAVFPATGADWREWGVATGTASATAAGNALAWATTSNIPLIIPPGEFKFTSSLTATAPTVGNITIRGASQQNSIISFSGSEGLIIKSNGAKSIIHVSNLTIATYDTPAAGHTGLYFQELATGAALSYPDQSDVISVTFRGIDGMVVTDGWSVDFKTNYMSNLNFYNDQFGDPNNTGTGIMLAGESPTGPDLGVVYNITSCVFNADQYGLYYGPYIQGVNIVQSNFGGQNAVYVPSGEAGTSQLTFANNQIAYLGTGFSDGTGVSGEFITNNFFLPFANGAFAIGLGAANDVTITGNVVKNYNGHTGDVGINITASTLGVIQGNIFDSIASGVVLQSGTAGLRVADNQMTGVTTPYSSVNSPTSFSNFISLVAPVATTISNVGDTGLSPDWVQLTVASTAGFYTGEWVCVEGTSGGSDPQSNICTTISVTDGTHLIEQGIISNGSSYASGGTVSAIP